MPIPIQYETADYQGNETLKGFADTDSLGKAYLDLHARASSGSIELLPEELRKDPALATFKTIPDLAKSYVETKKMIGSIDKAPEKAELYKFTDMANLHPNIKAVDIQNELRSIAHKAGLGNKAADIYQQEVLGMLSNKMAAQDTARKELMTKNETALRQEWGAEYDQKFDQIVKTLTAAGGPDAVSGVGQLTAALKGNPVVLKMMGKIVGLLSEDSIKNLGAGATVEITGATEAQAEIVKLNAEIAREGKKHPFHDAKHPDHIKFNEKMTKLFTTAYPQS